MHLLYSLQSIIIIVIRTLLCQSNLIGAIDMLAFIGGSKTADTIIKEHPHPHRLKLFLQLEGKNLGIVTPDADLDVAAEQVARSP